ncbi:MAG: chaperone protein DnaK, partial [Symbiobacteriaceae bacterium]|nr:chaperone protein DnaK [Symbiobacteriaceae bacterium]
VLKVRQVALLENDGRWQLDLQDQPPFDIAGGNAPSIGLVLKEGPGGSFRAKLLVATNDPYQPEQTVALQAHVVETPQVSPAYVGIDFGTTHSCICVARPGQDAKTLELDDTQTGEDRFTMPSAVYWPKPPVAGNLRDCIVGRPALRAAEDPSNEDAVALSIKRKMGKRDTKRYLGVPLAPHEVAARVIRYMVDKAEDYLGAIVEKAVVTVPANYTPPQVRATVEACRLAGLEAEVVRSHMMDEPVGAAVDYLTELDEYKMMEMGLGPDFHALVYDFGGGTLDVSIIRYTYNGYRRSLKVVATKGDNFMGGDDLTELLREHLRRTAEATLQQNHGLRTRLLADPPDNRPPGLNAADQAIHQVNYTLLRNAAEAMKRKLSDEFEASGRVELRFMAGSRQHSDFMEFKIARRDYEKLIRERMESTGRLVERALTAAKLRPGDIQLILMVGKSSRTPLVGNLLEEWFRRDPVLHPEPKACVARGAYKKGEMDSLPGEEETDLVRELDRTNCRYGIISGTWRGKMFRTAIPEGVPFVATGSYPPPGTPLTAVPGVPVIVALNRGENDLYKDNEEIVELGQVMVDGQPGGPQVALEIEIQVEDHRNIHVQLRVDGKETKLARFEEY